MIYVFKREKKALITIIMRLLLSCLPFCHRRTLFILSLPLQLCSRSMRNKKVMENRGRVQAEPKIHITSSKFGLNTSQNTSPLWRVSHPHNAHLHRGEIRKREKMKKKQFFVLTVEDLETTTATTSWISSDRVGARCPLRKSGPCSSGWGISRCPKSLFVLRGRSCALPTRGGAERAPAGSAASTDVSVLSHSRRFRRRRHRPKTPFPLSRRQGPSSLPR